VATQRWSIVQGAPAEAVTTGVGAATTGTVDVVVDFGALTAANIPRSQWLTLIRDDLEKITDAMMRNVPTAF
jgi:hypothetical protein